MKTTIIQLLGPLEAAVRADSWHLVAAVAKEIATRAEMISQRQRASLDAALVQDEALRPVKGRWDT